jgi:hypothetical protein
MVRGGEKIMVWKILFWAGFFGFCIVASFCIYLVVERPFDAPIQWEIEAHKVKGPGAIVILEPDEEIISFDSEKQVVYIKRRKEVREDVSSQTTEGND